MAELHPDEARLAAAGQTRAADIVSHVLDPAVLIPLGAWLAAFHGSDGLSQVARWFALLVGAFLVVPSVCVVWLTRRGRLTDRNMVRREERVVPLVLTGLSAVLGVLTVVGLQAPVEVRAFAVAVVACLVLVVALTALGFKASIHAASAAAIMVELGHLYGGAGAAAGAVMVSAVAWARHRAGRHTLPQVLAGGVLGALTTALVAHLMG